MLNVRQFCQYLAVSVNFKEVFSLWVYVKKVGVSFSQPESIVISRMLCSLHIFTLVILPCGLDSDNIILINYKNCN